MFYDTTRERDLDYQITQNHCELRSFPLELYVPRSEVAVMTLYISKDEPLADFYHVMWFVRDQVITQVFSTTGGCFEDREKYTVTFRYSPRTFVISGLTMGEMFRQPPRVTAFNNRTRALLPSKVKIRFHFKQAMSRMEWFWDSISTYLPLYTSVIPVVTSNLI